MTRQLSKRTVSLLRDGCELTDDWRAVRRAVASVVNGYVASGFTVDAATKALTDRRNGLARQASAVLGASLGGDVEHLYSKAVQRHERHARLCREARRTIADRWHGADWSSFLVLLGLYAIAERCGRLEFTTSARQVAEAAGVGGVSDSGSSWQTAWAAAHRLHDARLIALAPGDHSRYEATDDRPSEVRLPSPERLAQALDQLVGDTSLSSHVVAEERDESPTIETIDPAISHVAWEQRQGLGPCAGRVWYLLHVEGERSAAQLAARLGVTRDTATEALKRLMRWGLATRPRRGRYVVQGDVSVLDSIAEQLGISDRRQRRADGFERYRQQRRNASALRSQAISEQASGPHVGFVPAPSGGGLVDVSTGEIVDRSAPVAPAAITVTNMVTGAVELVSTTTAYAALLLLGDASAPLPERWSQTATETPQRASGAPQRVVVAA